MLAEVLHLCRQVGSMGPITDAPLYVLSSLLHKMGKDSSSVTWIWTKQCFRYSFWCYSQPELLVFVICWNKSDKDRQFWDLLTFLIVIVGFFISQEHKSVVAPAFSAPYYHCLRFSYKKVSQKASIPVQSCLRRRKLDRFWATPRVTGHTPVSRKQVGLSFISIIKARLPQP